MPEISSKINLIPNRVSDRQLFLILGVVILLIGIWVPVIQPYLPSKEETYFELAILGAGEKADNYYPENDPNINTDEILDWNIHVYNHIGSDTYVSIRVKLLNSTMSLPNSAKCTPSDSTVIYDLTKGLANNQTIVFPLSWSINDINNEQGFTRIQSLTINDEDIRVDITDIENNFRLIFELWIYNSKLEELDFGWKSDEGKRCAWTHIWFNIE